MGPSGIVESSLRWMSTSRLSCVCFFARVQMAAIQPYLSGAHVRRMAGTASSCLATSRRSWLKTVSQCKKVPKQVSWCRTQNLSTPRTPWCVLKQLWSFLELKDLDETLSHCRLEPLETLKPHVCIDPSSGSIGVGLVGVAGCQNKTCGSYALMGIVGLQSCFRV